MVTAPGSRHKQRGTPRGDSSQPPPPRRSEPRRQPPARPPRHGLPAAPAARPCLQGDRGALQPLGAHGDPPRTPAGSGRERHGERGGEGRKGRCGSGGCQPRRGSPGTPLPPGAAERDALGPRARVRGGGSGARPAPPVLPEKVENFHLRSPRCLPAGGTSRGEGISRLRSWR